VVPPESHRAVGVGVDARRAHDDMWLFRRAREIRRPLSEAVRFSPSGYRISPLRSSFSTRRNAHLSAISSTSRGRCRTWMLTHASGSCERWLSSILSTNGSTCSDRRRDDYPPSCEDEPAHLSLADCGNQGAEEGDAASRRGWPRPTLDQFAAGGTC
jgi:hypothetical protein